MKKKILLVEDEAILAMFTQKMLEAHDFEVVTVHNGEKAIERVEKDPDISLILMDIDLGKGIDGTEAAQRILEIDDIPIVFLSSHTEPEVVEKTEGITSYGYIVKNSGETVLLASIKMAFRLFEAKMQEKQYKDALLHSHELMSYIIEHNQSAIAIHDKDLNYIFVSRQYLNQYNVRKRDVIGRHHYDVFPDLPQKWRDVHQKALSGEISKGEDDPFEREDGTVDWTRWECRPWFEADGSIGGIIVYTEVISKERHINLDIRDNINYVQSILRTTSDGFWVLDLNGNFIDVNNAYCKMSGYSRDEILQHRIAETEERIKRIISTGSAVFEVQHRRKDGSIFETEISASFLGGDEDKIICFCRDITKRKKAERELKTNEENLRTTLRSIGDAVISTDINGKVLRMNPVAEKLTGWTVDTAKGKNLNEVFYIIHADTRGIVDNPVEKVLESGTIVGLANHTVLISKNMQEYQIADSAAPIKDDEGNITGVVLVFRDVTDQYEKNRQIERNASLLEETQKLAHIGSWELDLSTWQLAWSDEIYRIFGLEPQEFGATYDAFLDAVYPEDRDKVNEAYTDSVKQNQDGYTIDHRIVRKDTGEILFVHEKCIHVKDENGTILRSVGMVQDITRQKETEEGLKNSRDKYKRLVDHSPGLIMETDLDTHEIISCNPAMAKNLGLPITSVVGKKIDVFIPADILEKRIKAAEKAVETGESQTLDDERGGKCFSTTYIPIISNERRSIQTITIDVTEQKELRSIEWMLSEKSSKKEDFIPEYGDVSSLNKNGLILTSVGKEQLKNITSEYLDILESSTAIYEKNGDYALGIFSSGWCQLMDTASRRLCKTEDDQIALESGKWLCHESCWKDASLSMTEGKPVELACNGGINMYAVPIEVNGEIVGAMNFGYGNPPKDEAELEKISTTYNIPIDELRKRSKEYKPRPEFIINYAKDRIQTAAKTLGYIIENILTKEIVSQEKLYLRSILQTTTDGFWVVDRKRNITQVNDAYCRMSGYSKEEFQGMTINELEAEERPEETNVHMKRIIQNGSDVFETKHRRKDGSLFDVEISTTFLDLYGGQFICFCRDITERKEKEDIIQKALEEKDYLMKELNHRVKNNLAMVSALVSLKESETRIDLSSLKNRIEAITRLHDELSRKNDMKQIEVKEYFQKLLKSVFSFESNHEVHIINTIEEVIIPSKIAIPLGLIINEIATNAIKYGFASDKEARFTIEMTSDPENKQYILILSNTGNPFPEDIGLANPETMGLQLVSTLVDQLDGTIELQKEPYPIFTIRFPIGEE